MKKIMILLALPCLLAITALAQNTDSPGQNKDKPMMDCCKMEKGKMMCMTMGEMKPMEKDMIMGDSTVVKTDGTILKKSGEKMKMKEGMCCDMMGKMHESHEDHKKKMKKNQKAAHSCPMHPEETSDKQGKCPKCGMMMKKSKK